MVVAAVKFPIGRRIVSMPLGVKLSGFAPLGHGWFRGIGIGRNEGDSPEPR